MSDIHIIILKDIKSIQILFLKKQNNNNSKQSNKEQQTTNQVCIASKNRYHRLHTNTGYFEEEIQNLQSKKKGKDQESIQLNTTHDPRHHVSK